MNFLVTTDKKTLICKSCGIEFKHAEKETYTVKHAKTEKYKNLFENLALVQTLPNNGENSHSRSGHF